jgi:TRAP-type C4-dicarboxylate transport system substrate-binding protein
MFRYFRKTAPIALILTTLVFSTLLLAASGFVTPTFAAKKQVIKFASLAPDGTTWMRVMRALDKDMRKATNKAVRFRIYPGGVSGNEKDVVRKMRVGQLHAAGFTGVGLGEILPAVRIFEIPFFFRNYKEVDAVHRELDGWFEKAFLKKGYVLLGWSEVGFAHFFSNQPIKSISDLSKQKVWMWEGDPIARAYFRAMGVRAIPLAVTDVLTSLQTGLIETVYISPLGAIALQWFTKVRYISPAPMANVTGAVIIRKKIFGRLAPAHQKILMERTRSRMEELRRLTRKENTQAIEAMKKRGLKVSAPPAATDLAAMRRAGQKAEKAVQGKLIPADLLTRARRVLAALRSGK